MRALVILCVLLAAPKTPQPTVSVTPRFSSHAPASVRILARRHSSDDVKGGAWCLGLWSEDSAYSRMSCDEQGDGPDSVSQAYPDLPPGRYTVDFLVRYSNGQQRQGVGTFCVIGGEVTCSEDPPRP